MVLRLLKQEGVARGMELQTRCFEGSAQQGVSFLLCLFPLFVTYMNFSHSTSYYGSFMGYVVFLIFLLYPPKIGKNRRPNYLPWYDVVAAMAGLLVFVFYVLHTENNRGQNFLATGWSLEVMVAVVGLLLLGEACRRILGNSILWVGVFFFISASFMGRPIERIIYDIFYSDQGVISAAVTVCATYLVLFGILASFLECIGVNAYFVTCAQALVGRGAGGAAKVEVISSALCGMVSGSSVENTLITGSKTIPLMKKSGYSSTFSAAVSASASLGGQIMPPIMGSAAFLMAYLCDIPYKNLIFRAILPAFLYFLGIFLMVHFKAQKFNLGGVELEDMPTREELVNKSYLLLPILVLLVLVLLGFPVVETVIFATFLCIVLGLRDKDRPLDFGVFFHTLQRVTKNALPVALACAMSGMIAGIVNTTGVGRYIVSAVVSVAGYHLLYVLIFTMFCCLLVGMAMPTVANYAIMASVCAPILTQGMGLDPILAHMFLFYFCMISDVTPPLSIASTAAAQLAKANPFHTSCTASVLSMSAFVIPYMFVFHPALLLIETDFTYLLFVLFTATLGMFAVSIGVVGYLYTDFNPLLRGMALTAGFLLVVPELYSDLGGIVLIFLLILQQIMARKKKNP